ncbi:hypothetical protein ACI0FS_14885, partial [Ochrobactrum quorumnocens]|uniref:hypothetical protein n=1 Tax=Ochrobactrum quorumnocens TaxID=271865 RepID=UPI0038552898
HLTATCFSNCSTKSAADNNCLSVPLPVNVVQRELRAMKEWMRSKVFLDAAALMSSEVSTVATMICVLLLIGAPEKF